MPIQPALAPRRWGLLHLSAEEALTEAQWRELRVLAITASESITLALSNITSQETLRDWQQRQPLT